MREKPSEHRQPNAGSTRHRAQARTGRLAALRAGALAVGVAAFSGPAPLGAAATTAPPTVTDLRCEYATDPIGIDAVRPRLSWQLRSDARDVVQSAYQVQVTVLAQPQPGGGLSSAEARLQTMYGEAATGWAVADSRLTVSVTVPPNARATARLPMATLAGVTEGGRPVEAAPGVRKAVQAGADVVVEVGSGRYAFAYDAPLARKLAVTPRFDTWTPIETLLANARAKAVLDRLLPGVGSGMFAGQARRRNLQQMAAMAPALLTEETLRALDEELGAIPE